MEQKPIQAATPETPVETPAVTTEKVVEKETIGKVLDTTKTDKPMEVKTVPESAFLKEKKDRKAAEKALADLKASIEGGATTTEVSDDIASIAEEHNIDPKFLKQLAGAIEKTAERKAQEKIDATIKPIEARERAEKVEKVFATHFDKAMAEMPEYTEIVNREVIKTLSLDPANQDKTFQQLIEETYGRSLGGKRTFETTTPRGGKTNGPVDFARASKDSKYLEEVLANPETKAEYNKGLTDRLSTHL